MVDTTNEWIMERVGIRERHIVDKGVAASDLAVAAVKNLLEHTQWMCRRWISSSWGR